MKTILAILILSAGFAFGQNITNQYSGQPQYAGMQLTTVPSAGGGGGVVSFGALLGKTNVADALTVYNIPVSSSVAVGNGVVVFSTFMGDSVTDTKGNTYSYVTNLFYFSKITSALTTSDVIHVNQASGDYQSFNGFAWSINNPGSVQPDTNYNDAGVYAYGGVMLTPFGTVANNTVAIGVIGDGYTTTPASGWSQDFSLFNGFWSDAVLVSTSPATVTSIGTLSSADSPYVYICVFK